MVNNTKLIKILEIERKIENNKTNKTHYMDTEMIKTFNIKLIAFILLFLLSIANEVFFGGQDFIGLYNEMIVDASVIIEIIRTIIFISFIAIILWNKKQFEKITVIKNFQIENIPNYITKRVPFILSILFTTLILLNLINFITSTEVVDNIEAFTILLQLITIFLHTTILSKYIETTEKTKKEKEFNLKKELDILTKDMITSEKDMVAVYDARKTNETPVITSLVEMFEKEFRSSISVEEHILNKNKNIILNE